MREHEFLMDAYLWEKMSNYQKAVAIVHEALWDYMLEAGKKDSIPVRFYNQLILKNVFVRMTDEDYSLLVKKFALTTSKFQIKSWVLGFSDLNRASFHPTGALRAITGAQSYLEMVQVGNIEAYLESSRSNYAVMFETDGRIKSIKGNLKVESLMTHYRSILELSEAGDLVSSTRVTESGSSRTGHWFETSSTMDSNLISSTENHYIFTGWPSFPKASISNDSVTTYAALYVILEGANLYSTQNEYHCGAEVTFSMTGDIAGWKKSKACRNLAISSRLSKWRDYDKGYCPLYGSPDYNIRPGAIGIGLGPSVAAVASKTFLSSASGVLGLGVAVTGAIYLGGDLLFIAPYRRAIKLIMQASNFLNGAVAEPERHLARFTRRLNRRTGEKMSVLEVATLVTKLNLNRGNCFDGRYRKILKGLSAEINGKE